MLTAGCPDTDGDGVVDKDDKCPTEKGLAVNGGCPEVIKEDKEILDLAVKNVNFDTGSANLTGSSFETLDKIVVLMNKYSAYSLTISGYTDNVGNAAKNKALSMQRAESTKTYLTSKGIQSSRIKAFGFGDVNPIASNATKEGKSLNRRVEFVLKVE